MKKCKEWRTTFKIPIYECNVFLVVTDCVQHSKSILPRQLRADGDDTDVPGLFCGLYPNYSIMFKRDRITDGVVAHEVGHLCRRVLDAIGYELDLANDECLAYLEEWMTNKVRKLIFRNGKIFR